MSILLSDINPKYAEYDCKMQARHLIKHLEEPCPGHPTVNKDGKTTYYGGETKYDCRICLAEIKKELGI